MRRRVRQASDWLAEQVRWHRWAAEAWREARRPVPYVGTLSNDEIAADDWDRPGTLTEPEHPPETW